MVRNFVDVSGRQRLGGRKRQQSTPSDRRQNPPL